MSAQSAPIEVFYSYADADEDLRSELDKHLSQLRRDGLISTWHKRQIVAGQDWTKALDQYLNRASVILLLVSSDFLASDYCYGIEVQRAMERYEAREAHVIPILLRPVAWQSAPFGKLQALPDNATPITMWSNRDAAFTNISDGIRTALENVQRLAVSIPSPSFPRIWNIPYSRNPVFTGREEILSSIYMQLQSGQAMAISQPQAISGLGGIGKTQIAIELAYRYHQDYQVVLWTLADTRESLFSGYVAVAELLNLPEKNEQDQTKAVQAVIGWLTTHTGWLIILDNADELTSVYEFFPPRYSGHFLLTTRAQAVGPRIHCVEVDVMSQDIGALFLLRRAKLLAFDAKLTDANVSDVIIAREICEELAGLPLALDQAGAYVEETQCGLAGYYGLYRVQRAEMLKERGNFASDYPESVATTWTLSFKKVEQHTSSATDLLRFCAFLAPDAIPEELIEQGAMLLCSTLEPIVTDPHLLNEAVRVLLNYSLIRRDSEEKTFSIHRLVQAVLIDIMPERQRLLWRECVLRVLNEVFPEVAFEVWTQCQRLLPHVLACAAWIEHRPMFSQQASHLLYKAATYLRERAQYLEAEQLMAQALTICEQQLGTEHPDTAMILNSLANLYRQQGKYEQAEPLYKRALAILEQRLGAEHPDTAIILNGLANYYHQLGKYEQAEPLYQRALAIREQHLGSKHPDTAKSLNNLAVLYQYQGKYEQAEPLYRRALLIKEQQLGTEHPSTALALNNLAELYWHQGKYEQAEPLYRRALLIKEQQLGVEHPDTADSLHGLADLYRQQGKYEQAEVFYQRTLGIYEQHLGAEHPDTAEALHGLAELYQHQGKYEQAEALYKRALSIYEQHLGVEHPDTAKVLHGLAELYQHQGKYEQAEAFYQRALSIREQHLGPTHHLMQETRQAYVALLTYRRRLDEETKKPGEDSESRSTIATHLPTSSPQPPTNDAAYQRPHEEQQDKTNTHNSPPLHHSESP